MVAVDDRRRARGAGAPRRRAARRAPPAARRDHRARDGQADRAGARRGRLLRRHLRVLRRQRRVAARGRADRAARGRGLGVHPPQLDRRPARDHAVELPLLPGGALRRPEPRDRQHDPAQARAAVPRVGRRDRGDLPRGRLPRGRLHQHLRDQRADRRRDRRPARAGRLADRLGARRRGRGRDRRPQPQEGRARARRLRPVHPAQHRRPRRRWSRHAVAARLENTGQACNAAKRFIVADELYEPFVEKFTAAITAVEPGDPTSSDTGIGPLSSTTAADRLEDQVKRAVDSGATLVAGGERDGQLLQTARC